MIRTCLVLCELIMGFPSVHGVGENTSSGVEFSLKIIMLECLHVPAMREQPVSTPNSVGLPVQPSGKAARAWIVNIN